MAFSPEAALAGSDRGRERAAATSAAPLLAAADFSDPHFDLKRCINSALRRAEADGQPEAGGAAEERAARVLRAAQHLSEKVAGELDALSERAAKSAPRVLLDLEFLRREAAAARARVQAVRSELDDRERDAGPAFRYLRDLDLVKSRMEAARCSLREAQNWSNLADEVDSILGSGEAEKAGARLAEARKSLVVFANTPEYGDRRALLRAMQNRLEQSLRPQVAACLRDHDTEAYRRFAAIFDQIEKGQEFARLHFRSREQHVLELWKALVDALQAQLAQFERRQQQSAALLSSTEKDMSAFVDELFVVVGEEVAWCRAIGMDPRAFVTEFTRILFTDMNPSLGNVLRDVADKCGKASFLLLVNIYEVFEDFGINLERLLTSPAGAAGSAADTSSPEATEIPTAVYGWGGFVYEPFLPHQLMYGDWERRMLDTQVRRHLEKLRQLLGDPAVSSGPLEIAHHLTSKLIPKLFAAIHESIRRCLVFTKGLGAKQLVLVVDEFADGVIRTLGDVVGRLCVECGLENRPPGPDGGGASDVDDEKEEGEPENWVNFQVGLRLIGLSLLIQRKLDHVLGLTRGPGFREARRIVELALDAGLEGGGDGGLERFFPKLLEVPSSAAAKTRRASRPSPPSDSRPAAAEDSDSASEAEGGGPDAGGAGDAGEWAPEGTRKCQAALAVLVRSDLLSAPLRSFFDEVFAAPEGQPPPEGDPLRNARSSNRQLTAKAQRFVFDATLAPVVKQFAALPRLAAWKKADGRSAAASPLNLEIPQFSLSPSPYVTRLGEHLLMLPQHFEPYADDEGLKFSVETIPYYDSSEAEEAAEGGAHVAPAAAAAAATSGARDAAAAAADPVSTEQVTHIWLTSIARGAMALLAARVLQIPFLSPRGARQLSTDLGYLTNVLRALEIRPTPLLAAVKAFCEMPDAELAAELARRAGRGGRSEDDAACKRVAAMRRVRV